MKVVEGSRGMPQQKQLDQKIFQKNAKIVTLEDYEIIKYGQIIVFRMQTDEGCDGLACQEKHMIKEY